MKKIDVVSIKLVKDKDLMADIPTKAIKSPTDAEYLIRWFLEDLDREHFIIILLDTKHQISAIHTVGIGSLNSCIVHPREVFKPAILANAHSIILSHNHPSGVAQPSNEDIKITKRLIEAGEVLGIEVLDHIILGDNICSMKEIGLI